MVYGIVGVIIGFIFGVYGASSVYNKKIKKADNLEELKKWI